MAGITRIPGALARVQEEQIRAGAEQDAFEAFASRIKSMDAGNTPVPPTPGHGRVLAADSSTRTGLGMARVREAYQETVMATPHYTEDYDEPLFVNVTNEFSAELATAITHGGSLTPTLQQALVEASKTAAAERTTYQNTLGDEYDALQDAKRRLRTLTNTLTRVREQTNTPTQGFPSLLDAHGQVENLRTDCAAIIEDRQATLASRPQHDHHLQDYLYRERDWTYPVLADTLDCHTKIQQLEHKLIQTITHHP